MRWLALIPVLLCVMGGRAAELDQLVAERFQVLVRVGRERAEQHLRPQGTCLLLNVNDEIVRTVEGGEGLRIEVVGEVRASPEHRIFLGEFEPHRKTAARALAARIGRRLNFPTEVLEVRGSGGVIDHLLVVLGRFQSEREAAA